MFILILLDIFFILNITYVIFNNKYYIGDYMYNTKKDVSIRIQKIMIDLKINQNQLATLLEVTQPAVSKYLKGRIPPPNVLLHLSQISGRTIEWILTGENLQNHIDKTVSEKSEPYLTKMTIEEKFKILPKELQNNLESIIDSLIRKN